MPRQRTGWPRGYGIARVQLLTDAPMAGRKGRARGTREPVFADLPYIVGYRVTDQVEILAVVHTARDWPESLG